MSITVTLPFDAVEDPSIAQALARLFLALGDSVDASDVVDPGTYEAAAPATIAHALAAWVNGLPAADAAVAATSPYKAVEPVAAPPSVAAPARAETIAAADWTPAASTVSASAEKARRVPTEASIARAGRRGRVSAMSPLVDEQMDLVGFVASLPPASLRFIQIVQRRRVVRLGEIVEWLALPTAKALGGITGAIARWAPLRGVKVPFEAFKIHGERAWRWLAKDAPDFGDPELPVSTVARRMRPAEPARAPVVEFVPEPTPLPPPRVRPGRAARAAETAPPAPVAAAPSGAAPPIVRHPVVEPRATIGLPAAYQSRPRTPAPGPVAPHMARSGGSRGPSPQAPVSQRPAPAPTPAPAPVRAAPSVDLDTAVARLSERLSEQQLKVIEIIRGRGTVTMRELRDELKLHKAQHLTELMRSIDERAAAASVELPWNLEFDASGEKTYYWGYELPPASERPTVGGSERPHPANDMRNNPNSRGAQGVRVRRSRPIN